MKERVVQKLYKNDCTNIISHYMKPGNQRTCFWSFSCGIEL